MLKDLWSFLRYAAHVVRCFFEIVIIAIMVGLSDEDPDGDEL